MFDPNDPEAVAMQEPIAEIGVVQDLQADVLAPVEEDSQGEPVKRSPGHVSDAEEIAIEEGTLRLDDILAEVEK